MALTAEKYPSRTETKRPPRDSVPSGIREVPILLCSLHSSSDTAFTSHLHTTYPNIRLVTEPNAASALHSSLPFPIYTAENPASLAQKVDLTTTFGGDGTILHASSLFAASSSVPPVLAFSMGTLGFLGEWKFPDYKRAFREVYMSGLNAGLRSHVFADSLNPSSSAASLADPQHPARDISASSLRGKSTDNPRSARVLLRNRLKVALYSSAGDLITPPDSPTHALNEIILHRGAAPHLAHIAISVSSRHLTYAIADGLIISTPTGSTAYSLSAGGSIIHPLVPSLLLTPICPRSLSFRPLVLPGNMPISLRLGEGNRGRELEVSVDGVRRSQGLEAGMEVRVWGEEIKNDGQSKVGQTSGVPILVRAEGGGGAGWVRGLNGLLKFNHPFGEGVEEVEEVEEEMKER